MRRFAFVAGAILALSSSNSPVLAQEWGNPFCQAIGDRPAGTKPNRRIAQRLYGQASGYFRQGRYDEAAVTFTAAYHAAPNDQIMGPLLWNIAIALEKAGKYEKAAMVFECYNDRFAEIKEQAELPDRIAALKRKQKPETGLALRSDPLPGDQKILPTAAKAPSPSARGLRSVFWLLGATSAASLAAGIGFGLASNSKLQDLEDTCAKTPQGCAASDIRSVEKRALVANLFYGVAFAAAGAAAILYLDHKLYHRHSRRQPLTIIPQPTGLLLQVNW